MAKPLIEQLQLGELLCWRLQSAQASAVVAQQGAQLLSYQVEGQPPLIWLSPQATYQGGQAVRGGVPVCWPWFGELARNPLAVRQAFTGDQGPAHGLVRSLDWQLAECRESGEALEVRFSLDVSQGLPDWPHQARLELSMRFGRSLSLELITQNLMDRPLPITQALHSYFAVSDSRQISIHGLHGCRYLETLQNWQERQQHGPLRIAGETDRVYLDVPECLSIEDPLWKRRIQLQVTGSRSAVVWNPWVDKAQRLSQFAADAWQDMLCIETARVSEDWLEIPPQQSASMGVTISSQTLKL